MGYELWVSRTGGYRRKGTRASELRELFEDGITANSIQEPLKSCLFDDYAAIVAEELRRLDFDIAGAKREEDSKIEGFVRRTQLAKGPCSQYLNPISPFDLIAESTPLIKVLDVLRNKNFTFVLAENEVVGIITRADLQKPPVRILLFGLISLYEMHISYLVRRFYPDESWKEQLTPGRLESAKDLLKQRKTRNEEIDLLSCLQLSDKKTLALKSVQILEHFGLPGKKTAEKTMNGIEKIRDKLAHSQDLATGMTWEEIIDISVTVEDMLNRSDRLIEEAVICGAPLS